MDYHRLTELLVYDPMTGVFTWDVGGHGRRRDAVAGHINNEGYRMIQLDGTTYSAHRLAFMYMTGKWPDKEVDHINQVKDDNRWENLREVDHSLNQFNTGLQRNNSSGYKGVCFDKKAGTWRAYITYQGKRISLGSYSTPELAAQARADKEKALGLL